MTEIFETLTSLAQPDLDWGFAVRTLLLRFIAVIVVLWLIQITIQLSSRLLQRLEGSAGRQSDAVLPARTPVVAAPDGLPVPPRVAAAIALALALERKSGGLRIAQDRHESSWASAGRSARLRQ